MNGTDSTPAFGHALGDKSSSSPALLAFGDAGADGAALHFLSLNDPPLHALAPATGDRAMRYTPDDDDIEFEFAAGSFCPSPERCQRQGCRGICNSPAA